jgi:hypothetical protein
MKINKLLIPTSLNREACLQQLWDKLHVEGRTEDSLASELARVTRHLEVGSAAKASLAACDLAYGYLRLAVIDRRKSALTTSDAFLRKSFVFAYWARELDIVARVDPEWSELVGDDLLMTMVAWQALSTACGSPWFALWLAPHLHNQFGHPDAEMPLVYYSYDKPARRFMEVLQRSLITGVWPQRIEAEEMSAYGKLLQACQRPSDWPAALVEYCDWRIANAYGYAEMGATKRRRQSAMASVLDVECVEQVFPVELLTLRFAFERATGQQLSLDAPHPMLQGPLMAQPFPTVEPMHKDEWTERLRALRENSVAAPLPLRAQVVAKYLS